MPQQSTQVSPEEAERNASEIEKLWDLAKSSKKRYPNRMSKDAQGKEFENLKTDAKAKGLDLTISRFSMYRIRKVAIYHEEEIKDLGERIRAANSRFSATHLFRIVALAEKTTRDKIEAKAVSKSWTSAELDRNMQLADKRKRKPNSGRRTTVPQGREQRLKELAKRATKWLRWTKLAFPESKERTSMKLELKLDKFLREAISAVTEVQKELDKHFGIDNTLRA